MTAISLQAVAKRYGDVQAVRRIDLTVERGESVALPGQNGAGKSTTIGMLLGLVRPDAGTAQVCGRTPRQAVAEGRIAAMLQDTGMMPGVTVGKLIGLGHRLYPDALPVAEALDLAGLAGLAKRRVDKLSGGQSQRLRFALAIVANPDVLVLDEPTRALDVQGRTEFWKSMRAYAETGRTLLFATHYLDEVNENADRVVVITAGRVVADDTPDQIRRLAGGGTVRFRLQPGDFLPTLAAATDVQVSGETVTVRTADPDATVRSLAATHLCWSELSVGQASLDESFLLLTEGSR